MVMNNVVVLNVFDEAITTVSWQRAITMVHGELAEIIEYVEGKTIRSPSTEFLFPKVIKLYKDVVVTYRTRVPACSKKGVLRRDNFKCVYCDRAANTVDHIIPRAKGGPSTWENLAACCQPCNNKKGDKTLKEAGLRLQWIPQAPEIDQVNVTTSLVPA